MLFNSSKARAFWLVAMCGLACAGVSAQTPLIQEVTTVADSSHAVPVEHEVDIAAAGTYQVKLTDLGAALTPSAPLASLKLAVISGNAIVGNPLLTAGSLQFTAAGAGKYFIHVVGAPGTAAGSGPIGILVTSVADGSTIASFSDNLALPSTALPTNESTIDDTFNVSADGNYTVTLTDLQLPQALTALTAVVTAPDGTVVTAPPLATAGSITVALQHGVAYRIFAVGQADPTVNAGLYSAVVSPSGGGGAPVYQKAVPVGLVAPAQIATLTAGTSYSLQLTDFGMPSALATLRAVLLENGLAVAQLTGAGSSPAFTAGASANQLFVLASATTAGSYAVAIAAPGSSPAVSYARAVTAPGNSLLPFSFDVSLTSAASYSFSVTDFQLPGALTNVDAFVVQGGAVVGSALTKAASTTLNIAAGPASILVFAQPATTGGLMDVNLTPTAGGPAAFDITQGVGQLFAARPLPITAAGSYAVNVADLQFPAQLANFAVVVTQGSSQIGSIYGAGAFSFNATPGNYFVNFVATPGGADGAGTYAMSVAPGPILTFSSSVSSVTSGGTVTLTWSAQNATSCTASDGWGGSQALSGSATSPAITSAATFTLTCSGNGVNVAKSVSVAVTAPPSKSGGGGAIDPVILLLLVAVLLLKSPSLVRRAARAR